VLDQGRGITRYRANGTQIGWVDSVPSRLKRVEAVAASSDEFVVVDSGAGTVLRYAFGPGDAATPVVMENPAGPGISGASIQDIVSGPGGIRVLANGIPERIDPSGTAHRLSPELPDVPLGRVSGIASDGVRGMYLADPSNARLVHVQGDGTYLGQVVLSGGGVTVQSLRAIEAAPDGSTLFGVTAEGIVSIPLAASE
jgi:hypothetical protein